MRRRRWLMVAAAIGLVLALLALWPGDRGGSGASTLSHGSYGWYLARHYLEARGATIELGDRPLTRLSGQVLVVSFPIQYPHAPDELESIDSFLRGGGTLVYAYSSDVAGPAERGFLNRLGLDPIQLEDPPLNPLAWWRQMTTEWRLPPADARSSEPIVLLAPRWLPSAPDHAEVLFRSPQGAPVVTAWSSRHGRVVVLPAELFANSRLDHAGNADLLESLYLSLGEDWRFDEYHHGLVAPDAIVDRAPQRAFDLLAAHLLLCYLLAIWALARRFGPAWQESTIAFGSTAEFLIGLGRLHDRLGHHRQAAELLVERAVELDPRLEPPAPAEITGHTSRAHLLGLARSIGQRQGGGRYSESRRVKDGNRAAQPTE